VIGQKTTYVRYAIDKAQLPALLGIDVPKDAKVSIDVTREEIAITLTTAERVSE
jgi:hypothetical protein